MERPGYFGNLPFPSSVITKGEEVLAGPIALVGSVGGQKLQQGRAQIDAAGIGPVEARQHGIAHARGGLADALVVHHHPAVSQYAVNVREDQLNRLATFFQGHRCGSRLSCFVPRVSRAVTTRLALLASLSVSWEAVRGDPGLFHRGFR